MRGCTIVLIKLGHQLLETLDCHKYNFLKWCIIYITYYQNATTMRKNYFIFEIYGGGARAPRAT